MGFDTSGAGWFFLAAVGDGPTGRAISRAVARRRRSFRMRSGVWCLSRSSSKEDRLG